MKASWFALVLVAACLTTGCEPLRERRGAAESEAKEVVFRFIEDPPITVYSPGYPAATSESLVGEGRGPSFVWTFDQGAALEPWTPGRIRGLPAELEDLALRFDTRSLIRKVDLEAATIKDIRLRARGFDSCFLLWADAGQPFSWNRQLAVATDDDGTSLFTVARHPEWRDRVRRLMVLFARDPASHPEDPIEVHEIAGLTRAIDVDAALRQAHKVRLGNEVRDALLALPDHVIERQVRIPPGAELRFAYGLDPGVRVPVHFRVAAEDSRGGSRSLFEETVSPDASSPWRQAAIDLSQLAGPSVRLRLETRAAEAADPPEGFALWGHPEILKPCPGPPPPNVVLIVVDTLRPDRLSLYGNPRPTSPRIDDWARRSGAIFRTVVASTSFTLSSHFSIFTGIDAHRHGITRSTAAGRAATGGMTMLAELFRQRGYATAAFTGGGWVHPRFGFDQGFDVYRFQQRSWTKGEVSRTLKDTLTWLQQPRRPFFLFFHTYEVHGPFHARQPFFSRFSELAPDLRLGFRRHEPGLSDQRQFVLLRDEAEGGETPLPPELSSLPFDQYDSGVAFLDAEIGRLLARLEEPDLKEQTIVVLTSDHGERLGEGGLAGHGQLHDSTLLVPLVVAAPGGEGAGAWIEQQARSVDLLPTILELAGLDQPDGIDGVSLLPAMRGEVGEIPEEAWSYSRSSGISVRLRNRLKYTFQDLAWSPAYGTEELFDLYRDPGEEHPLAESPESRRLRARVREVVERQTPGLRIRFENSGTIALTGSVDNQTIDRWSLKSVDLPCPCITFRQRGSAAFRVPPGEAFTLILEPAAHPRLRLSVATEDAGQPFDAVFDVTAIETVEGVFLDGSSWRRDSPPAAPRTGVSVWVQGKGIGSDEPDDGDESLRRQLEALGYLD